MNEEIDKSESGGRKKAVAVRSTGGTPPRKQLWSYRTSLISAPSTRKRKMNEESSTDDGDAKDKKKKKKSKKKKRKEECGHCSCGGKMSGRNQSTQTDETKSTETSCQTKYLSTSDAQHQIEMN